MSDYYLAMDPNTSPETLELLSNDGDYYVRHWVADNPSTPQYIKDYLKICKFIEYYKVEHEHLL